jgi:hypothetical protein
VYRGPIILPIALIVLGIVLLLANMGYIALDLGELVRTYWPLIFVLIGAELILAALLGRRGAPPAEELTYDLDGAELADVRLNFGAGRLLVGGAPAGRLLVGTFEGGVRARRKGASVELSSDADAWWSGAWRGRAASWQVGLTTEVPLRLTVQSGASQTDLELGDLRLAALDLRVGASETACRLPLPRGRLPVSVELGAASVRLELPDGAAARVRSRLALGTTDVSSRRFTRTTDGHQTADFEQAADRYEIEISGGAGSVAVV